MWVSKLINMNTINNIIVFFKYFVKVFTYVYILKFALLVKTGSIFFYIDKRD